MELTIAVGLIGLVVWCVKKRRDAACTRHWHYRRGCLVVGGLWRRADLRPPD
jgi:hypothetical protein